MKMNNPLKLLVSIVALVGLMITPSAKALVITPIFKAGFTSYPGYQTMEDSIQQALNYVDSVITNNITITVDFNNATTGGAYSNPHSYQVSYYDYYTALQQTQNLSSSDRQAISTLTPSATNYNGFSYIDNLPTGASWSTNQQITMSRSLAEALGLAKPIPYTPDADIYINQQAFSYTNWGATTNAYLLEQATIHEIGEVLGGGGEGSSLGHDSNPHVMDLFRFSAPNTRSYTTDTNATAYFSINNGSNNLVNFNQSGYGDYGDWDGFTNGAQSAIISVGQNFTNYNTVELTALDIIGWNVVSVPEPSALLLLTLGAVGLITCRSKKPSIKI